ncbi:calcium-binding protein [Parasedimentitalea maritima]|uniref:Calcium-binding protein n=1 Tax=Parasedimentitalea maritima TaxID=2578117 RepID=A0ABY2V0Z1_9RHOB|nr:EF-hand domain-containing protein [Zongyanglinia marina]TLP67904.1 calcium-binding protein [Zongyanglinia marina]
MKKAGIFAVIAASAGLVGAGAVLANSGPGRQGMNMTFEKLDADGNGEITQAEVDGLKAARFAAADANGDGALSLEELQAQGMKKAEQRAAGMLERHDANGDGVLSQDELPKPRRSGHMFERMDADGNGTISKQEFEEARNQMSSNGMGKHRPGQSEMTEPEQN